MSPLNDDIPLLSELTEGERKEAMHRYNIIAPLLEVRKPSAKMWQDAARKGSCLEIAEMITDSGLPYIILQPGVYMENLLGPWTRPFVAEKDELPYPVPEDLPLGWIASDDWASSPLLLWNGQN